MKHAFAMAAICAALAASPSIAGSLSDPVVTPEVVTAEAEADSSKTDALVIAVWLATMITAVGTF